MNTKEQSFKEKEIREQKAMKWYELTKELQGVYLTTDVTEKYAPIDNWMISGATECLVEVKVRTQYTSTQINNWGGAYIEFNKLEGIRQHLDEMNIKLPVYYFNFFQDCLHIYEIDLDPTMYSWSLKKLQKDDFDKGKKVYKFVAPLKKPIEILKYS